VGKKLVERLTKKWGRILKNWERKYNLEISLYEDGEASVIDYRFFNDREEDLTPQFSASYSGEEGNAVYEGPA